MVDNSLVFAKAIALNYVIMMTKLERYHPERYRASRPFVRQIVSLYKTYTGITTSPNYETCNAMFSLLVEHYNQQLSLMDFEKRPSDTKNLANEHSLAMHYSAWSCHGRQIFHFGSKISEQFRHTEIDQIQIGLLKFPYDSFYLSFGVQDDLPLGENQSFVDGAYISVIYGELIQVVLTTCSLTIRDKSSVDWVTTRDKYYYLTLSLKELDKSVLDVLEESLDDELKKSSASLQKQKETIDFGGIEVKSRRRENIKVEITETIGGFSVFRESLKLIINGLCYLSAYPDDVDLRWPDDTPRPMLEKLNSAAKIKDAQRTISKLNSMGYTKINYCGKLFEKTQLPSLHGLNELRAHWRRGHWRNQAHGQNMSQRKMIWIMPVMVKREVTDSIEEFGHIYLA